ncbi:hypothetical protein ACFYNF_34420 [Streptomyces sp. NPDC006641]|uniref:hypothetical protein n=1 Tax=unclassified Streptomyces TaxID=2593676 RepID=UPI0036C472D7
MTHPQLPTPEEKLADAKEGLNLPGAGPMSDQPEPRTCGNRFGEHTCQRSPSHTYPHRDAKQKGTETRSWWNGKDVTR